MMKTSCDIKVSVIIPCYNVEQYLPRCLDSLVSQTLENIEIVCVNDASPDNSIFILRDYEARYPNIRVIDLKENLRQGGARNRGMEASQGEYIAFVDSDDWVEADMYEKLYNKAREADADVVSCDYDTIDQHSHVLSRTLTDKAHLCGPVNEDIREELCLSTGSVCTKILKKGWIDRHNILFPEKMFYEDNLFNILVGLYCINYQHLPEPLYHYFVNTESVTRKRNSENIHDREKSLRLLMNYFHERGIVGQYANMLNYYVFRTMYNTAVMYVSTFDNPKTGFLRQIKKTVRELTLKTKGANPFYHTKSTRKERLYMKLLMFSPGLYLQFWYLRHWLHK